MKQPSGNISAVYQYRFGEKSSVCKIMLRGRIPEVKVRLYFKTKLRCQKNIWIGLCPDYNLCTIVFFIYQSIIKCNRVQNMSKQHRSNRSMLICSCCWTVDWVLLEPLMAAQRLWWPSTVFWSSVSWRACWTSWSRICSKHSCPQSPTSGWTEAFRPASDTL